MSAVLTPCVPVPAPVAADIAPFIAALLERARLDRAEIAPETAAVLEELETMGRAWKAGWRGAAVPIGSDEVPFVDTSGSEPVEWISVKTAAAELAIRPRSVTKRIAAGTLRARKVGRAWEIDVRSVKGDT